MRSTFKLLFYINRQKTKKNGKCPIMGRVTLDGKVSQYSTGLEIEPDLWDAKAGKACTDGRKTGNITGEKRGFLWLRFGGNHQECRHGKVRSEGNAAVIV